MIRQLRFHEDGITLTELLIAMLVAAVVSAAMVTWTGAVLRSDRANRTAVETIDELRFAKTQLVTELRYARDVYPPGSGDDSVSFWLDDGDDTKESGEEITYEIVGGVLQRSTDDTADPVSVVAEGLMAAESAFVITGSSVDITLGIDLDTSDPSPTRTIHTTVNIRNI